MANSKQYGLRLKKDEKLCGWDLYFRKVYSIFVLSYCIIYRQKYLN